MTVVYLERMARKVSPTEGTAMEMQDRWNQQHESRVYGKESGSQESLVITICHEMWLNRSNG